MAEEEVDHEENGEYVDRDENIVDEKIVDHEENEENVDHQYTSTDITVKEEKNQNPSLNKSQLETILDQEIGILFFQ